MNKEIIYNFVMKKKEKILPFWIYYNPDFVGNDLYIEEFGYGVCSPGWLVAETRKNYLLQFVYDGIAHVAVDNKKPFIATKGTAFLLPPNLPHWYKSDNESPTTRAWISWSGEQSFLLKKYFHAENNPFLLKVENLDTVIGYFNQLKNARNRSASSIAKIYCCFYGILSNCLSTKTSLSNIESQEKLLINDIIQYIEKNISETPTIHDISLSFGYDESSIFRKFKQYTGLSPKQYIMHKRIALAKGLICETNLSIDEIASRCGYNDKSALNLLFIRHEKMSLAKYIDSHRFPKLKE